MRSRETTPVESTPFIQTRLAAHALLVAAAIGWSLNGVIIKSVAMPALPIAFYRSAVAALFLAPLAWRRRRRLDRNSLELGGAYTATVILLVLATQATTAANAIILHYTAPFFVFLFGIPLLGERPSFRDWLGLLLAMAGVAGIFGGAAAGELDGIVFGIGSGISFALVILLLRRDHGRDPLWVTCCNNLAVAVLLLPWVWRELWISRQDLALMLTMGIVQLGIPYVLFSLAVRQVSAREASLLLLLEPLLNPVWVALVVGEIPGRATMVGGAVVLVALLSRYLNFGGRSRKPLPITPG